MIGARGKHEVKAPVRFREDGTFRVLQLADVQDGPEVSADAIALIRQAILQSDPDLVVLTGDQIRGYDPAYAATYVHRHGGRHGEHIPKGIRFEQLVTGDRRAAFAPDAPTEESVLDAELAAARSKVRSTFAQFLAPVVEAGVPFAATYGNHDFQCGVSVEEQDDMYREFAGCLNPKVREDGSSPDPHAIACEPGTFAVPVASSDGDRIAMSVMLVNSGDFEPGGGYGAPSERAIAWLEQAEREVSRDAGCGGNVPAIAFQHIPTHEYYQCLKRVSPLTPWAVEGYRMFSDACYVVNEEVCRPGSTLGEGPCCSERNVGEVETMRQAGGYFALFCGHDHKNTFVGHVDGLDLGYAPTCGFCSYGPKARDHALRLFVFHQDDPADYETRLLTYGDLIGGRVSDPLRLLAGEYMISGLPSVRDLLRHPGIAIGLASVAWSVAKSLLHRGKPRRDLA